MNKRNRVTHQTTHIRHTSDKVECVSDVWEERWLEVMETFITSADKIRLVEGSGPLARAFLTLPVTMTPFVIGKYREIVTERIVRRGVNRAERTRRGTIVGMVFRSLTLAFTVGGGMS